MTTRRFHRSTLEAFGTDAWTANPIQHYPRPLNERVAGWILAVILGITGAAALVHWWST